MPRVIPVKFTFAFSDLWFDPAGIDIEAGDHAICETERGLEMGLVTEDAREVTETELKETIGDATLKPIVRKATDEDYDRAEDLAAQGDEALPVFRRLAKESGLPIKPVGVEYLFGGERCVCYFAAEERVDFRQLVRDLSRALHERIDMRQIGVREEAALMGGFAGCGQELCCARWETRFEPVSIRMAKEQDLPLNSPKISGVCGRLMCCLRYEFEAYRDFKGRAPKKNAVIETPLGKAKICEYDTPREMLGLRLENGKSIKVPLAGMECSKKACKKAEENGCACRPDTVTRSMLESLQSSEVQMALAELDRANSPEPEDYNDSDIVFVSESRRRRRRAQVAEKKEEAAAKEAERARRAARKAARGEADRGEGSKSGRRRRRHHDGTEARQDGRPGEGRTRRRRPGDGGGQGQQSRQGSEGRPSKERGRDRSSEKRGGDKRVADKPQERRQQDPKAGEGNGQDKPPRRRRRRSNRPKGDAPSAPSS
ncbi:regulatory iron-sulfur-containing complex subunit RicT [Atopobiaceae bacterium 24-176]